jgi:hypothetical protein
VLAALLTAGAQVRTVPNCWSPGKDSVYPTAGAQVRTVYTQLLEPSKDSVPNCWSPGKDSVTVYTQLLEPK